MNHPSEISIQDFTYELPTEKIALFPNSERDGTNLLVYKNNNITKSKFSSIIDFLPAKAVLVFNDTKVIAARLNFETNTAQKIEVFCLAPAEEAIDPGIAMASKGEVKWKCLVGNLKKWKEKTLVLEKKGIKLSIEKIAQLADEFLLNFQWTPNDLTFIDIIEQLGQVPIPPYLKRESDENDAIRYQTVYSNHEGSVAAPTAGLHFTKPILSALEENKIESIYLTLHVGAGTFKPVKSVTMQDHDMHAEWMNVNIKDIEHIRKLLDSEIICVGTTSLRALESIYWMGLKTFYNQELSLSDLKIGQWDVYELKNREINCRESLDALIKWMKKNDLDKLNCETQILIAPPYELKVAKGLITNFHQPRSTLLLLVAAIIGEDWKKVYDFALKHDFKFLSYGDSSLLLK